MNYSTSKAIFNYAPPALMVVVALVYMVKAGSLFAYVSYGGLGLHAWSLICLASSYLLACLRLRFLPLFQRNIVAAGLTVAGINLYDLIWGFTSYCVVGSEFPLGMALTFSSALVLLLILDKRLHFLAINGDALIMLLFTISCFTGLLRTGFFQDMVLYTNGGGADPNVGNYYWLTSKMLGLLIMPLASRRGVENQTVKVALT